VVAPLNNLMYNMDPRNLSVHGLHPRWLHLVNLAVLFGPLAFFAYAGALRMARVPTPSPR